jgi:hypothetical protein
MSSDVVAWVLKSFVGEWQSLLDTPDELRVGGSFWNQTTFLGQELESWITTRSAVNKSIHFAATGSTLLARLVRAMLDQIPAGSAELTLFEAIQPAAIKRLRRVLEESSINAAELSLALAPIVETIENPFPALAEFLAQALPLCANEVRDDGGFNSEQFDVVAQLGARAGLLFEEAGNLKKWIEQRLSEGSVSFLLTTCRDEFATDGELLERLDNKTRAVAGTLALQDFSKRIASAKNRPFSYKQIRNAGRLILSARRGDDYGLKTFLSESVASLASRVLHHSLIPVFQAKNNEDSNSWDGLRLVGEEIGQWLAERHLINTIEHEAAFGGILRDAARSLLVDRIATTAAEQFLHRQPQVEQLLGRWLEEAATKTSDREDSEIHWYVADKAVQQPLWEIEDRALQFLEEALKSVCLSCASSENGFWTQGAIQRWFENLLSAAAASDAAWRFVAWDRLGVAELRQVLAPIAMAFSAEREFELVIPVVGVATKDPLWRAGGFTWYTHATHSLGEELTFAPVDDKPQHLLVSRRIVAVTAEQAQRLAKALVEPALSTLSFALSVDDLSGGFRPDIDKWFFYGDPKTGGWGWSGRTNRTQFADREINGGRLAKFSHIYASLVDKSGIESSGDDVQSRFVRALFWYRSGRWQPNPIRRLLDHFVALEHLFASGQTKKEELVADGAGRFFQTWAFRESPFAMEYRWAIDAARTLSSEALANPEIAQIADLVAEERLSAAVEAREWRERLSPWLSPSFVREVTRRLPSTHPQDIWMTQITTLERFAETESAWTKRDTARYRNAWFKIRRLAKRRHAIVHDAVSYFPGMEYEADGLTRIVEAILIQIAGEILSHNTTDSIHDLLLRLTPPWIEAGHVA